MLEDLPREGHYISTKGKLYSVKSVFLLGTDIYRKRKNPTTGKYYNHFVGKLKGFIC